MAILAGRDACILLALGIVFFLARSAYTAEEREFGKRAYGYFVTLDEESLPSFGEFVEGSTASNESSPVNGTRVPAISGMAKFDHAFYLLVHDVKTDVDGPRKEPTEPRMRVLSFCDLKLRIADVVVQWGEHDPASDLEAVCVVPGKAREFWTAESRYYKGQFGRLMRVELGHSKDGWRGTLLEVVALPENLGDEVEGLLCLPRESSNLLILALRGGGRNPGKLVWGHVKESRFEQTGERTIELDDTVFSARDELRRCTALFLSSDDIIWGSAASDPGTFGPFVSYIYKIGAVDEILRSAAGQKTINEYQAVLAGLKVEALSSAPFVADLSIGTDDESFGGIWRPVAIPTSTAASRADDQP